jgi:hypothetical protein
MELLLHVTQGYGYNFIADLESTIYIGFVLMIWAIVLMGHHKNMQLLGLQF